MRSVYGPIFMYLWVYVHHWAPFGADNLSKYIIPLDRPPFEWRLWRRCGAMAKQMFRNNCGNILPNANKPAPFAVSAMQACPAGGCLGKHHPRWFQGGCLSKHVSGVIAYVSNHPRWTCLPKQPPLLACLCELLPSHWGNWKTWE